MEEGYLKKILSNVIEHKRVTSKSKEQLMRELLFV